MHLPGCFLPLLKSHCFHIACVTAGSSTVENNHVNGSASCGEGKARALAEAEWASNSDGTKQAFFSLEQAEQGQIKSPVREVFKR